MDYNKYYKKTKVKSERKIERVNNIDVKESISIDKTIYILLVIALVIIPLFIKAHITEFISPKLTFLSTGMQADIFSYYKYTFLIILTIIVAVLFVYKLLFLQYNISKRKSNLFLGILAVVVTLSAIFSPYKSVALHGMFNRHEGAITFICYLTLFFVAANTKYSIKQMHGLLYCLYPFVIINMILGIAILKGKNLIDIDWIHNFILGSIPEGAQISEGAKIWATVSNPNFISGIGAVLTVLFLTWAIFDQNKVRAGINVVVAAMSMSMIFTSLSTSGFLTIIVLLPVVFILIFFNERKVKPFVVLLAFVILATSIFIPLANKDPRVWNETFGFVIKENPFVKLQAEDNSNKNNNTAQMDTVSDVNLRKGVFKKGLSDIFLPSKAYADGNSNANDTNKFEIPTLPASSSSAGSGRAYIWEKTIETAMKRPILGYGLDTFVYVFPQNDINKVTGLGTHNIIVDKPHNIYLALLMGSGIFALLAFVTLVGAVLFMGVKAVLKRHITQQENAVMFALLTASIAYLVQGMFNDFVIGATVIFWILLGVLVSILHQATSSKKTF
ncbi:O-antigen ligase family protein [Schinkia azotoformans]|uniref:O-antigen ligase family protein n=1 Tax=Schinkia azotoformans TaxID=1454 RepID=UPI002E1C5C69|nr:O-antigen ligase family protein [Schinkia azotoformans]